jgi:hypothetical protein
MRQDHAGMLDLYQGQIRLLLPGAATTIAEAKTQGGYARAVGEI